MPDIGQAMLETRIVDLQDALKPSLDVDDKDAHSKGHRLLQDASRVSLDLGSIMANKVTGIDANLTKLQDDMNNGWKDGLVKEITKAVECKAESAPEATTFKIGKAEISTTSLKVADKITSMAARLILYIVGIYAFLLVIGKVDPPKAFLHRVAHPVAAVPE